MKKYESPNAEYIKFYSEEEISNTSDVDTWDILSTPEDFFG
jgi:hypothetical protein